MNVIAVTIGEPAGIGPEIALKAAWEVRHTIKTVLIGDIDFLTALAQPLFIPIKRFTTREELSSDALYVESVPLINPPQAGRLDVNNAPIVLSWLDRAVDGILNGDFDALATAPVQKGIINEAGIAFTGHTEYLAEKLKTKRVVMVLAGNTPYGYLRVALATTHLPLKDVAQTITQEGLEETLQIIHHDLNTKWGIPHPMIYVAGLNPHAGEGGFLGREELDVIIPTLERVKKQGLHVLGPFSADTLFLPPNIQKADCFLTLYHDQGLPVLKYATFGGGINVTLGLPIVRTSVDHGTALDLAQTGQAHFTSMKEAIVLANEMV